MVSINLAYVVAKLAEAWNIDFIDNAAEWSEPYFWAACWIEMKFIRYFYHSINQVDTIFSSKVVILPNKKNHWFQVSASKQLRD